MLEKLIKEKLLPYVSKPARYLGNEWNVLTQDWDSSKLRIALAFPDVYEVGMSHLGLKILRESLLSNKNYLVERVFAPWVDLEERMRAYKVPLFSLESWRPLKSFDLIGFTLQYELSFSNVVNMLDLAGIPIRSEERADDDPIIMGGGPCAFNPEPVADFFDLIVIGEGEEVILEIAEAVAFWKEKGKRNRKELLLQLSKYSGVYVPSLYNVEYGNDGIILNIKPKSKEVPKIIKKRIVTDLDSSFFPTRPIVPHMEIVHDRIMLELFRGCTRGCRFCQAGMIYRPVREKKLETLLNQAEELVKSTGYNEIGLTSLSSSDYSKIKELAEQLLDRYGKKGVGVSLPSLRIDNFSLELAKEIQKVRKAGLTFAPEAGTQRLRDVINKGVTEEDVLSTAESAFRAGWSSIKLYFMIGLPTETDEDVIGIADLAQKVYEVGRKVNKENKGSKKQIKITVSVSSFVPKSHTPFQWVPQNTREELKRKQELLKNALPKDRRKIDFNWHDVEVSFLEGVFARGDRRLSRVIERAQQLGCKFDGWTEEFKFQTWMQAFSDCKIDPEPYAYRKREFQELLPWEHIDAGVTKDFLMSEYRKAMRAETTWDCRQGRCTGCGISANLGVVGPRCGGEDLD
ncbi:MAG TPA: TIGR03960 family B12-binding radical SAM protein [Clostridia bacterium]|jgi:radical SAM family uncharacterized protein|nr:TIGR03960 family B12-binding radical SAM protein [Clostridia bacterium]